MPERDRDADGADRERVDELVAEYLDRLNSGERIDPIAILSEHPEHGPEVVERLEVFLDLGATERFGDPLGTLGDFTLHRQIGRGGMGVVYEAHENSMERTVALKVLPAGIAADDRAVTRFIQEARLAGKLGHPNVVGVFGMGVTEQTPYYAMEYVEGETLARILARTREAEPESETPFGRKDRPGYFEKLAEAFAEVADGLQHAHSRGVIHRDVKPSNLILDGERRLRILDFGLARLEGQESMTLTGDVVGTPLYMSPEQARRQKIPVDHRTDVYSLGATMYEAICGRPPFRGRDQADTLSQIIDQDALAPRRLNPRVPQDLETIVLKCLRKDAADRYGTAEALGQDLGRFVRGDAVEARPETGWGQLRRVVRRRRIAIVACLTVLLLAGLVAGLLLENRRRGREAARSLAMTTMRELSSQLAAGEFVIAASLASGAAGIRFPHGAIRPAQEDDLRRLIDGGLLLSTREACRTLERIVEDVPGNRDAHYHLARAYRLLGQTDRASETASRVLEIDPAFVPAAVLFESIRRGLPSPRRTRVSPVHAHWKTWLRARRGLSGSQWKVVDRAYTELLGETPVRGELYLGFLLEARLGRGVARLKLGDYSGAREDFAVAEHLAPGSLEPRILIARTDLLAGDADRCERTVDALHEGVEPARRTEVAFWVTMTFLASKDHKRAAAWSDRIGDELIQTRLQTYLGLERGDLDGAIERGRRAVSLADPRDPSPRLLLARALIRRAERDRPSCADLAAALRHARDAASIDPENERAAFLVRQAESLALDALRRTRNNAHQQEVTMRTGLATTCLLLASALSPSVLADLDGETIHEDWSDGSIFDGNPVRWLGWPCCPGNFELRDGACVIQGASPQDFTAPLTSERVLSGEVCLRGRGRIGSSDGPLSFGIHTNGNDISGYIMFLRPDRLSLVVQGAGGARLRVEEIEGSFSNEPYEAELRSIELENRNLRVELRLWRPESGESRPERPTLQLEDSRFYSGSFGFAGRRGASVEWIEVSTPADEPDLRMLRGDSNNDGGVDVSDAPSILNFLFLGAAEPDCAAAADANADGMIDIADPAWLLNHLFLGRPAPPSPYPACGVSESPGDAALGCEESSCE